MNHSDELSICTELNRFLQSVDTHVLEAMADLKQINLILDEAVVALNTSFFSIHDSLEMYRNSLSDEALDHINPAVNQAITALQFHDLTTQLSSRLLKRLTCMSDIVKSAHSMQNNKTDICIDKLIRLNSQTSELNKSLHKKFNQSLNQQHMESGDVELF